jgi:hypothetical protein
MTLKQIAGIVTALGVIIGAFLAFDGRYLHCNVYAEGMSVVQSRQLRFEERAIQKDINDLEDRLESPKLPEKRRGIYQQRLRELKQDLHEIKEEKASQTKGGAK